MRGIIRQGGLWILIMTVLWALARSSAAGILPSGQHQAISYRNAASTTAFDVLEELRENIDGGRVTAWTQRNNRTAKSDLNASASVDVIWLDGDGIDIWDLEFIAGFMPQNDSTNCAIDAATANKIFGSTSVLGLTITVDGVELMVSGVFELPQGIATTGADPGRGMAFCPESAWTSSSPLYITAWEFRVYASGLGGGADTARSWLTGSGIAVPSTVIDRNQQYDLYFQLTSIVGWMAALLLCVLLFIHSWKTARAGTVIAYKLTRNRITPNRVAYRILAFSVCTAAALLLAGVGCVLLADFHPYIPPEYLPTQWSDLAFWGNLITGNAQNAAILDQSPTLRPDAMIDVAKDLCWIFSLGSNIAMLAAFRCVSSGKGGPFPKGMPYVWGLSLLSPILAALIVRELGFLVSMAPINAVIPFLLCAAPTLLKTLNLPIRIPIMAFHTRKKERTDILYDENQDASL